VGKSLAHEKSHGRSRGLGKGRHQNGRTGEGSVRLIHGLKHWQKASFQILESTFVKLGPNVKSDKFMSHQRFLQTKGFVDKPPFAT